MSRPNLPPPPTGCRHLYVIGNGFDRYHGAASAYADFHRYLLRCAPDVAATFDRYFGPQAPHAGRTATDGAPHVPGRRGQRNPRPPPTWAENHQWSNFEECLCELDREKIFDSLDAALPRIGPDDSAFRYADYRLPLDRIAGIVEACTFEMKYRFHRWINTLHYARGFRRRMLPLDPEALFLDFNYTTFLESEYAVPRSRIRYLHGCRRDPFGSLVVGHRIDPETSLDRWLGRIRRRRRYRPQLRNARGRYYPNDRLAYLAYFGDERSEGWHNPLRYHAAEEAVERIEAYYRRSYKPTADVIDRHADFFGRLRDLERITVIGHSLGAVDLPYFDRIILSVDAPEALAWRFSCHDDADRRRVERFCRRQGIAMTDETVFAL